MRIRTLIAAEHIGALRLAHGGFTLIQMMVAVSIFLMVVTGSVVSHFYGLKMFDATQSKLGANTSASRVMDLLTTDIRSAYNLEIGNGTSNTFTRYSLIHSRLL